MLLTPFALLLSVTALAGHEGQTLEPHDPGPALGEEVEEPHGTPGESPIINGETATPDDWPMAGGLLLEAEWYYSGQSARFRTLLCSSTLIAPDVVLLAAHCVDADALTSGYGSLNDVDFRWSRTADLTPWTGEQIVDWPSDAVRAWDWVMHPEFDLWNMGLGLAQNNDIALLFLDEPVLDIPHAYLILPEEVPQEVVGAPVTVVGWGQQTSDSRPPPGTFGVKMMGESAITELAGWEFQVGLYAEDVRKCHGDSGGPSFMEVESDRMDDIRLVGVTSHAYDQSDCRRTGGVDTRASAYLDWIDQEMRARCADGTRAWWDEPGIVEPPSPPAPEDLLQDKDSDTNEDDGDEGCGCSSTGSKGELGTGMGLLALLGALIGARRRS